MLIGYEFRKVFSQRMKWLLLFILAVNALLYYLYLIPAMPEKEKQVLYGQLAEKTVDREELQRELDAIAWQKSETPLRVVIKHDQRVPRHISRHNAWSWYSESCRKRG